MMDEAVWLVVLVGMVVALGRLVPLGGLRKFVVIGLRVAAVLGVLASLRGWSCARREPRPPQAVYLVDQSASIDRSRTSWIARRLASLDALRPSHVPRTVIAFAGEATVVVPSGTAALTDPEALERLLAAASLERETTDLEQAALASLSATPASGPRRLILLSDGRQTRGNVERILPALRRFHVAVYPVPVDPEAPSGVVWEQLSAPAVVQQGSAVPLKLALVNGTGQAKAVEIRASLHGRTLARQRFRLAPGWRTVSLSVPAETVGTMALEVSVEVVPRPSGLPSVAGEALPQQRMVYVDVDGPPRVLLVMEHPTRLPLLASALKRRDMALSVATPEELPVEVGKLLEYDSVLLFQIPKSSLAQEQVDALAQYLQRFGGGLVMAGLGGNLKDELEQEAPLDALLPAWFEPKGLQEAKRRVCIVMLIDRSASMMGPRIAATKRAAVELVKQLDPQDLVGVLAFDTVAYVIVEVQQARDVSTLLIDKLVRLKSTGGTDVLPALQAAHSRLAASGATVKHILLLSDGNTPFHAKAYRDLMAQLAQERISISTIGIGAAFLNEELLEWLAAKTGGTFYLMRSLDELPQLIARDTQETLGRLPFSEGSFRPTRGESASWFEEMEEWPALRGYFTTTAKPQASVELELRHADTVDPLLTHWRVGRGQAALFASDADTRWSSEWVRWQRFDSVWAHLVRQTMRPRPSQELFVWVEEQEDGLQLVVEGELSEPTAQVVSSDGGVILPLALAQASRFRWRAPVGHLDSGWYHLLLDVAAPENPSVRLLAKRWIQIGRVESPREQPNLPPDEVLLGRMAQATGGVMQAPDLAFLAPSEPIERRVPLRGWLLPLVLLLLLAEVALRGRTML